MMGTERYETPVATAPTTATVRELAAKLADHAIGCVVIVDEALRPTGIVTDRDLTCRVVAEGLDPETTQAGAVMSKPLLTASQEEPLEVLIERMREAAVRRLPVVREGKLVGIVALDDLVVWLGRELDDLGEATRGEITRSQYAARRARRKLELEERIEELRSDTQRAGEQAREFLLREVEVLRNRVARLLGREADPDS